MLDVQPCKFWRNTTIRYQEIAKGEIFGKGISRVKYVYSYGTFGPIIYKSSILNLNSFHTYTGRPRSDAGLTFFVVA
jgi:hypothetical protein